MDFARYPCDLLMVFGGIPMALDFLECSYAWRAVGASHRPTSQSLIMSFLQTADTAFLKVCCDSNTIMSMKPQGRNPCTQLCHRREAFAVIQIDVQ